MKQFLVLLCSLFLITSCKKNSEGPKGETGPEGQAGPAGSIATGTITGNVTQYDDYLKKIKTNLNTITVTVRGTTLSAVTNEKGVYTFPSIAAGTYDLEFKGANTQVMKKMQVVFPGNGVLFVHVKITNKPTWTFDYISFKIDSVQKSFKITGAYSDNSNFPSSLLILFGLTPNMNNQDPSSYDFACPVNPNYNNSLYNTFNAPTYPEGTVFYAKIHTLVPTDYYLDSYSQRIIYYPIGDLSSPVYTLTMPKL